MIYIEYNQRRYRKERREKTGGIWHMSYQSSDKELLPAFVFLYNVPLHIIAFLKLFSWETNDIFFHKAKLYIEIEKELLFTSSWVLKLNYGI